MTVEFEGVKIQPKDTISEIECDIELATNSKKRMLQQTQIIDGLIREAQEAGNIRAF